MIHILYTLGEEIFNSTSHGIGAALSIAALVLMIVFGIFSGVSTLALVGYIIYGVSLIILYTMSTLYHAITNERAKKVFRVIDHASVYILIAGSITPYCFGVLAGTGPKRWVIFGIVWFLTLLGIVLYAIFKQKVKLFNIASYVIMGWSVVILFPELSSVFQSMHHMECLHLLIAGGITYTIGVIFYAIKKVKYFHSVWHLFVLAGSILHFIAILCYMTAR